MVLLRRSPCGLERRSSFRGCSQSPISVQCVVMDFANGGLVSLGELRPTPDLRARQTVSDPFQLLALIRRTGTTHCCLSTSYLPLARPCILHWHNESGVPFFFFFSFFFFSAVHQWTEVITALSGRHVQPLWRSSKWPAACRSPPPT